MSQTKSNEATSKLWQDKQRKERAKIRLCDDKQREVLALNKKALSWRAEHVFFRSAGNIPRMREAETHHHNWSEKALVKHEEVDKHMERLRVITEERKDLQEKLGMPPTEDKYVDCGRRTELGKRFVLLDHELDSTTSVRHYMDENMRGSSLFGNEE